MTGRRGPGTTNSRCPACRTPTLTQWVGDRAALRITADPTPLTPAEQDKVRTPNRLIWCLVQNRHGAPRLRWISRWHPPNCPHPHVTEHHCTAEPTTLF
ncbi:hypothetical protein ACFVQ4_25120 [Streptomyces laurentii]|uniref:hypothetical protein n=1 Tax=Streptomyces laurentii TaxID=39478 RepID=UPI0036A8BA2A